MPDGFIVGGKIQLEAPTNLKTIAANIQKELGNIKVGVDLNIRRGATTQIATMSRNLERLNTVLLTTTTNATSAANAINRLADGFNGIQASSRQFAQNIGQIAKASEQVKKATTEATGGLESFGRSAELSAKRFLAFGLAAGTIIKFTQAMREGVGEAISFQREMVRLAQVSTDPASAIKDVESTITKLSVSLGVASRELVDVAVTFKQAGLSINDTKVALEAVAEASLAPTFTNTKNTVEGSIAALQQFKLSANELKGVLGSINQVSADFAVESNDLVTAIQKSGGAFQAAGGNLNELLAIFTSVRQTTRESADTIATGLRTIFARLQRPQTLNDLEQLGIRLRTTREEAEALGNLNLQEQFVGPFEALRRISEGLNGIQQTDPRFAQVVESIGGLRQLSKVVPAIQQFSVAQEALNSALGGTGSLTRSTIQAQDALIIQVTKVREQYNALFRDLIGSKAFNTFASSVLTLASSFATLIDIIKPLLPLLTALTAIKIGSSIGGFLQGFKDVKPLASLGNFLAGRKAEAPVKLKRGGFVPGSGNGDSVPAMLEPGEFVLSNPAVESIGRNKVAGLNNLAAGGFPRAEFNKFKEGKFVNHTLGDYPDSLLNKVPAGSQYLASGTEAMVLKTPQGTVVRLGKISEERSPEFFRPNAGEVLQPLESQKEGEFVFEELPFAPSLPKAGLSKQRQQMAINGLAKRILTSGLLPTDLNADNIGLARNDKGKPRIKIIDPATFSEPRNEEEVQKFSALKKRFGLFANGGSVTDKIPAMLTPGEYVINAESAAQLGDSALNTLNRGKIPGFNKGGWVGMADGGDPQNAGGKSQDDIVEKIVKILGAKTEQSKEREAYLQAQIEKFKNVDFDAPENQGATPPPVKKSASELAAEKNARLRALIGKTNKTPVISNPTSTKPQSQSDEKSILSEVLESLGVDTTKALKKKKVPESESKLKAFLSSERSAPQAQENIPFGLRGQEDQPPFNVTGLAGVASVLRNLGRSAAEMLEYMKPLQAQFQGTAAAVQQFNVQIGKTANSPVFVTPAGQDNSPLSTSTPGNIRNRIPVGPSAPLPSLPLDSKAPKDGSTFRLRPKDFIPDQNQDPLSRNVARPILSSTTETIPFDNDRFREANGRNAIPSFAQNVIPSRSRTRARLDRIPTSIKDLSGLEPTREFDARREQERLARFANSNRTVSVPDVDLQPLSKPEINLGFLGDNFTGGTGFAQTPQQRGDFEVATRLRNIRQREIRPLNPDPPDDKFSKIFNNVDELKAFAAAVGKTKSQIDEMVAGLSKFGIEIQKSTGVIVNFNATTKTIAPVALRAGQAAPVVKTEPTFRDLFRPSKISESFGQSGIGNLLGFGNNAPGSLGILDKFSSFFQAEDTSKLTPEQVSIKEAQASRRQGLGVALGFGGQLLSGALDSRRGPATANSGEEFRTVSGISGAISGASAAAGVASFLPKLPFLPTLLVGAGLGIVSALEDAAKAIAQAKLDKSISDLSTKLNNISILNPNRSVGDISGDLDSIQAGANTVGAANAGIFSLDRTKLQEAEKSRRLALGSLAPQLLQGLSNEAIKLGSTNVLPTGNDKSKRDAANKLLTDNNLTGVIGKAAEGSGQSAAAITKQLQDVIIKASLDRQRSNVRDDSVKATERVINSLNLFTNSIESANRATEVFQRGLSIIPGLTTGNVGALAPESQATKLGSFGLPNNKEFTDATSTLIGPFGALGDGVKETADSFNLAATALPAALNSATKSLTDGDSIGVKIGEELRAQLSAKLTPGLTSVINILSDKAADFSLEDLRKKVGSDVSGFSTELIKSAFGPFQTELNNLGKAFDSEQQRISQNLAQFRQLQQQYNQSLERIVEAQTEAAKSGAEVQSQNTGQNVFDVFTREQARRPFDEAQNNLLRGTGLAGTDAAGIGNALKEAQQQLIEAQQSGGTGEAAARERDALAGKAQNLRQALENLTNTSKRASDIQDRLNNIRSQEQARGNLTNRLFTGDSRAQRDTIRGFDLTNQFRNAQDQQAFALSLSPEDRKLLVQGAEDVGGATGQNLSLQLQKVIGAGFVDANGDKKKVLEDELAKVQAQAVEAQTANSEALGNLSTSFEKIMNDSFAKNAEILSQNLRDLANTIKQQAEGRKSAAAGGAKDQAALLASGLSLDELKALGKNKNFKQFTELQSQNNQLQGAKPGDIKPTLDIIDNTILGLGKTLVGINKTDLQGQLESQIGPDLAKKFIESTGGQEAIKGTSFDKFDPFNNNTVEQASAAAQAKLQENLKNFIFDQKLNTVSGQRQIDLPDNLKALGQNSDFVSALQKAGGDFSKIETAGNALFTGAEKFSGSVDQLASILSTVAGQGNEGATDFIGPILRANGGSIFKPRGTDTVPAMLTPGEFVVNAEATRKNMALLHQINDGYADGGVVYARKGRRIFGGGNNNFVKPQAIVQQVAALPPAAKKAVAEQLGMPTEQVDLGLGGGNLTTFDTILGSGVNTSSFGNVPQNPIYRADGGFASTKRDDIFGFADPFKAAAKLLEEKRQEDPFGGGLGAGNVRVDVPVGFAANSPEDINLAGGFGGGLGGLDAVPEQQIGAAPVAANPGISRASVLRNILGNKRASLRNLQNAQTAAGLGNSEFVGQALARNASLREFGLRNERDLANSVDDTKNAAAVAQKRQASGPYAAAFRASARYKGLGRSSLQSSSLIGGKVDAPNFNHNVSDRVGGDSLEEFRKRRAAGLTRGNVSGFASGGVVPAYLHNGEFVVNKQSTSRNVDLLSNINNNPKHFAQGGPVGSVSPSGGGNSPVFNFDQLSTASEVLQSSIRMFAESSSKLSEALASFPSQISLEGKHTVEVIVNGTQALQGILPEVSQLIEKETKAQINKLLQNKFPDAGQEL